MNRKAGALEIILALILTVGAVYGIYKLTYNTAPPEHPGASDIPPRKASDSVPVKPPPDAGPVPGTVKR